MPCFECGKRATQTHHVVPRSKGGKRTIRLCDICHGKVHGKRTMSTSELTRAALQVKKSKNERVGSIPFGYDLDRNGRTLTPNPQDQALIRTIVDLSSLGYSQRAIVRALQALGVLSKGGRPLVLSQVQRALKAYREPFQEDP